MRARRRRYSGNLVEVAALYTAPVKAVLRVPNARPGWPSSYIEPGQDREELFTAREPFAFASRSEAVCGVSCLLVPWSARVRSRLFYRPGPDGEVVARG